MGMPKISGFLIGMVLVGLFAGIFGLFISNLSTNYGTSSTYDEADLTVYNKMGEISNKTEEIQEGITGIEEKTGILDIIGGFFSDAYQVLLLTKDSFEIFDRMSNRAIEDTNLGAVGEYLRIAIGLIVLILIFVGVILSAVIKREL